ncbi:hypothetical protein [Neptuniibacter sp. QD37_11]|uniref:hypothetical protein n=1 Tax=Neptuniibacter sp. QD37_11 TaxID=3398209 RepID=UPI0039F44BA8
MSDRVPVEFRIPHTHQAEAEALAPFLTEGLCPAGSEEDYATYMFPDVAYGQLGCEKLFRLKKIPYELRWESGNTVRNGLETFVVNEDGATVHDCEEWDDPEEETEDE